MADMSNGKAAQAQADGGSTATDRVPAKWAGWFGVSLTFLALIGFVVIARALPSDSLGFGALAGVAILSVSLTSLIIIARAIGILDSSAALGLPSGSIRALLALGLAVVFVAVASWTLGGLFDPTGKLVAQVTRPSTELANLQQRYPASDFFIFETQQKAEGSSAPSSEFKVYMKRGVDQNLVDMAKQILTVSATVLVTIIGFYFGSNSAADAARAVSAALKDSGDDGTTVAPAITDPQQAASTIASIAAATKAKLQSYGDDPMALLKRAVAGSTDSELMSALKTAQDQFAILAAKASAVSTDSDRAKEAAAAAAAASTDSVAVKQAKDRLGQLMVDATAANHDFGQAWAKFQDARNTILRKTAKG